MLFIAVQKRRASNTKKVTNSDELKIYRCTRCGKTVSDAKSLFYVSNKSPLFTANDFYTHICCNCTNDLFTEAENKFKDTKLALLVTCHYLDIFFSEELYESIKGNANFSFGNYLRLINGTQYKAKNFTTSLLIIINNGQALKGSFEIQQSKESKWKSADLKNKSYVIKTIGYDCFEDENYTDENRKFLFNTLSDYLTDDVVEDPHKLQCVIAMVKTTLQVENVDKLINAEFRKTLPDYVLLKSLGDIKDKYARNINNTANENGISAKTSGKNSKGANALTNIMKEMLENNYEQIKVNIVDINLSDSYKEISYDNAHALIEELNNTSDEYARLVAEQSEIVGEYQDKIMILEESIRSLKIENKTILQKLNSSSNKGKK